MTKETISKHPTAANLDSQGLLPDTLTLYPEGNQYPFDVTCREIVLELQLLHWKVPGVKVNFWMSTEDKPKPIAVKNIEGRGFRLGFIRGYKIADGPKSAFTNIRDIDIPNQHLEVFDDFSGPSFSLYRGFGHNFAYIGSNSTDKYVRYPGNLATYLIPDRYENHGGLRMPWEPKYLLTEEVFKNVDRWLRNNILSRLQKLSTP